MHQHSVSRHFLTLRLILHVSLVTFLVLGIWDLRNPEGPLFAVLLLAVGLLSVPSVRWHLQAAYEKSRLLRIIDSGLWILLSTLVLLELALAGLDKLTGNPLFMAPNAHSQERIERYKAGLANRREGDQRNSQGFNDSEWRIPKEKGVYRIVALGDSFAFGIVGYRNNFLTLLERQLQDHMKRRIEIANLGIPALDPVDYLEVLSTEGLRLEPDLVLVCLFTGNDFVRNSRGSLLRLRNMRFFAVTWRLYRLYAEERLRRRSAKQLPPVRAPTIMGTPLSRDSYMRLAEGYLEFLRQAPGSETEAKFRETLQVLDEIAKLAGAGRLLIAILPSEVQVNSSLRREVCRRTGTPESSLDLSSPARRVREHFSHGEVRVIDLLPAFQRAEERAPTYQPLDSHWNVLGNRVAARQILPELLDQIRRASSR